jgi:hypothetical protein
MDQPVSGRRFEGGPGQPVNKTSGLERIPEWRSFEFPDCRWQLERSKKYVKYYEMRPFNKKSQILNTV